MIAFETAPAAPLSVGSLLLTPQAPRARPPLETVLHCLQTAGLIGPSLSTENHRYRFGDHLFDLIAFTGCAVQLPAATDTGNGLEVRLEGPFRTPQLRIGRNSRPPRCPECQRPLSGWSSKAGLTAVRQAAGMDSLHCNDCHAANPAWAWQWGRHAGAGSFFVVVAPVFPGEGQPLPPLLEALSRTDVGPWHHFYVQE
jgi:hypothetical protein